MYHFEAHAVDQLSQMKIDQFARDLSAQPMGDMIVDWCRYLRQTASNQIEMKIITVDKDGRFRGIGILTLIYRLKWADLLTNPFKSILKPFAFKKWNPFVLNLGVLNIPLMHRPGLLTVPEIAPQEYSHIFRELIHYLRENRFGIHALCICTDPTCSLDKEFSRDISIARQFDPRAVLDYPYASFEEYYSALPGKRRQDVRRSKKALERLDGRIESCVDFASVSAEVMKLFLRTIDSNVGSLLIDVGEKFFAELRRLRRGEPRFFLAYAGQTLAGFCFAFQSNHTLFLKYCGLDYDLSLKTDAYFNMYYAAMEYASRNGLTKIDCGMTNNVFKERKLNCSLIPVTYWIDLYHPVFKPLKFINCLRW